MAEPMADDGRCVARPRTLRLRSRSARSQQLKSLEHALLEASKAANKTGAEWTANVDSRLDALENKTAQLADVVSALRQRGNRRLPVGVAFDPDTRYQKLTT